MEWYFVYDPSDGSFGPIAEFHQNNCSIEPLVDAHPEAIYMLMTLEVA